MAGNTNERYPAELRARAVQIYYETCSNYDRDWPPVCLGGAGPVVGWLAGTELIKTRGSPMRVEVVHSSRRSIPPRNGLNNDCWGVLYSCPWRDRIEA